MSFSPFNRELKFSNKAVQRLTALWALNESGLGGMMHALHIPFTGFLVGALAVILIGLIAFYSKSPRQVIQATVLVISVKAIVSPHSPLPAYVAVAFQGFFGALIYSIVSNFSVASILFGFIALLESAVQKFFITTILFGKSIWQAMDIFFNSILKELSFAGTVQFSLWLIISYCSVYAIWGMVIGWWLSKLPLKIEKRAGDIKNDLQTLKLNSSAEMLRITPSRKRNWLYIFIALLFITIVFTIHEVEGNQKAALVIARSIAVLTAWYLIIQPLARFLISRANKRNNRERNVKVVELIQTLASMKTLVRKAFQMSSQKHTGLVRYREFVFILIVITLYSDVTE